MAAAAAAAAPEAAAAADAAPDAAAAAAELPPAAAAAAEPPEAAVDAAHGSNISERGQEDDCFHSASTGLQQCLNEQKSDKSSLLSQWKS